MTKWEYHTHILMDQPVDVQEILAERGLQGWELVAYSNQNASPTTPATTVFIFKRPLKDLIR